LEQSNNPSHDEHVKPAANVPPSPGADATRLAAPAAEAAPLTPTAWLLNNAAYLLVLGFAIGLLWYYYGLEGVWAGIKVVVGLGFVIFIHELGHFLAAKWCDVHVQTFSIGFGPALPGCSFQRGETTYKISVLPLGGYVNMVGEGLENDEDENYPRSFKNKTVLQRMLIISAGVIMNVLLGCVLFIVVYYFHGVTEPPAVVGLVDAGSPLWKKGVPTGSLITDIDGTHDPIFKNLRVKVALSSPGEPLAFTFVSYDDHAQSLGTRMVDLLPRKEASDPNPIIGVAPPEQLRLPAKPKKALGLLPVLPDSPAAAARAIPLENDEVIVAATDPDKPDTVKEIEHNLQAGTFDYDELGRRVRALRDKKMIVRVLPRGADDKVKAIERDVPLEGFQWNDTIFGCTEVPAGRKDPYDPFRVRELPLDPRHPSGDRRDPFVFHNCLRRLAGKPMVIRVRRGDANNTDPLKHSSSDTVVNLFVPPAYHFTFGMRMKMGKVAGIRENSSAFAAGVQKGDEIIKVVMTDADGKILQTWDDLDPERLPFQLAHEAAAHDGKKNVILTVRPEPSESNRNPQGRTCPPVPWDARWDNDLEVPLSVASPLAIPQLGLAYWVSSQIVQVDADSPAATGGKEKDDQIEKVIPLGKGDTIKEFRYQQLSSYSNKKGWGQWIKLESERNGVTRYDSWAWPFQKVQLNDYKKVQVRINRPGDEQMNDDITLTAREDTSWPIASRGITLLPDFRLQKADSLGQALVMGGRETRDMIGIMYLQLRSLLTGRVSLKGLGGPIRMGVEGFDIAQSNNYLLLLYLAMISINLAVVNFLPIPILDGGHMVFLIYEKLRGRPPTEKVRAVATYIGLATIAFLMLFVFYQDIQNYVLKMFGS
jgi:membrane-associated protease RseP (regulator of RpoE activity)